jgi:predicted membrane-bound dolichyl-phosphate-mannose-protein mannosyltransferase
LQIDSLCDLNQLRLNNSIRVLKILKISKDIDTVKLITLINRLNFIETVNLPFIKSISKINLINANIILELELDYYIKYINSLQNRKLIITYNYPDEKKLIKYFNPNVTLKFKDIIK